MINSNSRAAGFILSLEALFAVLAFAMTCSLVFNLIFKGISHATAANKKLALQQELKKTLARSLLSPEHKIDYLDSELATNGTIFTPEWPKETVFAGIKDFLQLQQVGLGQLSVDSSPATDVAGQPQMYLILPQHQDQAEEVK